MQVVVRMYDWDSLRFGEYGKLELYTPIEKEDLHLFFLSTAWYKTLQHLHVQCNSRHAYTTEILGPDNVA